MNEQIVFTFKELLVGILYVFAITGALIKLAYSIRKIKRNDLEGFVKLKDFQEFEIQYTKDITELKKDVKYLMDKVCKK